jgi:hypothetical protein
VHADQFGEEIRGAERRVVQGLAALAELGVERVLLELPTRPEAGSLRELDRRAKLVTSFG